MKYNEKYLAVYRDDNGQKAIKLVDGKTFSLDSRLFICKDYNKFVLIDKKTGLWVLYSKTLKDIESKWLERKEKYEEAIRSNKYHGFVRDFEALKGNL